MAPAKTYRIENLRTHECLLPTANENKFNVNYTHKLELHTNSTSKIYLNREVGPHIGLALKTQLLQNIVDLSRGLR